MLQMKCHFRTDEDTLELLKDDVAESTSKTKEQTHVITVLASI